MSRDYFTCEYCGHEMFEHHIGPHEEECATKVWAIIRKDGPVAWWSVPQQGWVEFEDATTFTSEHKAALDKGTRDTFAAAIKGNWHEVAEPTDDLRGELIPPKLAQDIDTLLRERYATNEEARMQEPEQEPEYEPKDSIIQRMSAQAADARLGLEEGNNEALWDLLDTVEAFLSEQELTEEREHGVIVVFDVTGKSQRAAAHTVASVLVASDVVGHEGPDGTVIESWWFPEAGIKDVDLNDNADMTLVRRDLLRQLVDAYENGDAEWIGNVVHRLKGQLTGHAL